MKKNQTFNLKRHHIWWKFYTPIVNIISAIFHFKSESKFKMKKGEQYIVLSNHQTDLDPVFIGTMFNRPLCFVATDAFLTRGLISKIFNRQMQIIRKTKGTVDIKANMEMMKCMSQGGSLMFFPEGNRSYAEFQYPFTPGFGKFLKHFKKTIVLVNIHGGNGVMPRFGAKKRKGPLTGCVKLVLKPEDYLNLSDEEFEKTLSDNLKVFDSESGNLYKSPAKAEYLERMLFVCPKCGKTQTLVSSGDHIVCKECGLDVEFTEDLKLKSNDDSFKFTKLIEWYNYQIRYVKDLKVGERPIFKDHNVELYKNVPGKAKELIAKGDLALSKDKIIFNGKMIDIADIEIASPISGRKMSFSTSDTNYIVVGDERFNPLKYALMFNKLETRMKINKTDIYYCLEERK